jgi:hypothetical protein
MNLPTEQAVAMWLADSGYFNDAIILKGQNDEEVPNDKAVIYVACENTDSPATALYLASVRIIISSPAVIEDSLEDHRVTCLALRAVLRNAATMVTPFASESIACRGAVLNNWADSQDKNRWLSQASLTIGIVDLLA